MQFLSGRHFFFYVQFSERWWIAVHRLPLNLLPLRQHVPVSPSPVRTSTRPKKAPDSQHSTLSDTFRCSGSRCRPAKFSRNLWPGRACALKSHFSLISPFHLLNVCSHYRMRADWIGREGTAYLGNKFRRSIQNISCLPQNASEHIAPVWQTEYFTKHLCNLLPREVNLL